MKRIAIFTALVFASGLFLAGDILAQQRGNVGQAPGQAGMQERYQEQAQGTGTVLTISPAQLRMIQQRLNQLGYNTGQVNGNWDQQTAQAVQNYQKAAGLEPTGHVNTNFLQSIGLGNLLAGGVSGQQQQFYGQAPQFGGQQQGYQGIPQQGFQGQGQQGFQGQQGGFQGQQGYQGQQGQQGYQGQQGQQGYQGQQGQQGGNQNQ